MITTPEQGWPAWLLTHLRITALLLVPLVWAATTFAAFSGLPGDFERLEQELAVAEERLAREHAWVESRLTEVLEEIDGRVRELETAVAVVEDRVSRERKE